MFVVAVRMDLPKFKEFSLRDGPRMIWIYTLLYTTNMVKNQVLWDRTHVFLVEVSVSELPARMPVSGRSYMS